MVGAFLLPLVLVAVPPADDPADLREAPPPAATRTILELSARGVLKPAAPEGQPEPKPVPLKVESRFDFTERPLKGGPSGRVIRRVNQAAVAINGTDRPMAHVVRPEVATLVAERRDGSVFTYSPGGPLLRSELDLVQGPADPLFLPSLLPDRPVSAGETWEIGTDAARALSDYEALAANTLRGKLESLDAAKAMIKIAGEVRGAARGGEGTITIDGTLEFDRAARLIGRLDLNRKEVRKPGQVEAGLDFEGTLVVERSRCDVPPELADAVLAALPLDEPAEGLALLQFAPPDGRYALLHDRDWHLFWDDARLAVLKRLDRGELLAQCNLAVGPNAGPGRHQDPAQFRDDIRRALGERFDEFAGAGEIGRDDDLYAYKVAVRGHGGDHPVVWYYYLLASPQGDQLLVTFTLNGADAERFGDEDARLVGSLQWRGPAR